MLVGVCDAGGTCGWGLEPRSGTLGRCTRDGDGDVSLLRPALPPPGWPCGVGTRLMASNLRGTAEQSVVELELDAETGTLACTVDERGDARKHPPSHVAYPRRHELRGFPPGVALRPWAMIYLHAGDEVTLHGCLEEREGLQG